MKLKRETRYVVTVWEYDTLSELHQHRMETTEQDSAWSYYQQLQQELGKDYYASYEVLRGDN